METAFAAWLREQGESPSAYALRRGVHRKPIMRLAGVAHGPQPIGNIFYPTLVKVSDETGIPIGTLIEDATRAAANPVPPRKYERKAETTAAADA